MNECIDAWREATIFSTLDENSSYRQTDIYPNDCEKTAFMSHRGIFQFTRRLFGLRISYPTFQKAMDVILLSVEWKSALVYLDYMVVFSKTVKGQMAHLRQVLTLLRDSGVTLKLNNCSFLAEEMDYLGRVICPDRLEMTSTITAAFKQLRDPATQTEVKSFLGLRNMFRRTS